MKITFNSASALIALALTFPAHATEKIRDNLMLLEEAYNQEPGVIQHIQVLSLDPRSKAWSYGFTEEWPAPTDRHQLSVTVTALGQGSGASAGVGDLLINYRLQALGMGGEGALAIAPRLSLVLPAGDAARGLGRGALGLQLNLPVSWDLSDIFTLHGNAGFAWTPAAQNAAGERRAVLDATVGAAFVWLPLTWFNPLVEIAWNTTEEVVPGGTARSNVLIVQPSLRFAINVSADLQIVPGAGAPIRIGEGDPELALLGYLSIEHRLWPE